jgi:spore coat polysaccharide biosynthesis protein SpsF (cytidylyltransferase family)
LDERKLILAVVQARMGSTRLPGKVMKLILGTPMLFLQIERVMRARYLDAIVVATTTDEADDIVTRECVRRDVAVYRGSPSDVLDRYVKAARGAKPEAIVRLTGDCPLIDWTVIDLVVQTYRSGRFHYVSNIDPPTYPDGLDVEIVDYEALLIADAEARLASEREHVTPYIRKHPERFSATNVSAPADLSALRWTVDEPEDFELIRRIYEGLYPSEPAFGTADILDYLKLHPELMRLNETIVRNSGLLKSVATDKILRGS